MLPNPEEVFEAVLRVYRNCVLLVSQADPESGEEGGGVISIIVCSACVHTLHDLSDTRAGHDLHMDVEMQHSALRYAADDSIENGFALGLGLGRRAHTHSSAHVAGLSMAARRSDSSEPPEHVQHKAQRIFLSLCVQIIARYFVTETVPTYLSSEDRAQEDGDADSDELLFCMNNCRRTDMISRVRTFRANGTEALLALTVVKSDSRFQLTAADKQFALWALREVCVAAFEVERTEGCGLMIWCKCKTCMRFAAHSS